MPIVPGGAAGPTTFEGVTTTEIPLWRVVLLVAAGAIGGALLRYSVTTVIGVAVGSAGGWPWATFIVNILGSLLMGLFLGRVRVTREVPPYATPLVATGFLGGLTTFSAFAEETVLLTEAGAGLLAATYVALSVALAVLAVRLGQRLAAGRSA